MNRSRILFKSAAAHKRKLLLGSGTALVGSSFFFHDTEDNNILFLDKNSSEKSGGYSDALSMLKRRTVECKADMSVKEVPMIPIPTRSEQLTRLQTPDKVFDVLVIGGGATGAGAALDAASRGLDTVLIERGDFGNETSSRSTKLIWAGIRYIATAISALLRFHNVTRPIDAVSDFYGEFKMVMGAHKER